ncbi:tetratricopeptide repeat protein [Geobacter sp. DSM 9736]|uniref:peptidase MA family metallohydrolase n=1 Tax=Geobacter sp. DSM 9736 TaxID=1277350 RepID=UPI000B50BEB6|nr:tetratricopeptide repeat protein [Geobacter sp. DSM 9736]SNB45300.1 Tetratricopeptide repeat-containing protein [Geobacter sp. DSM 9736]
MVRYFFPEAFVRVLFAGFLILSCTSPPASADDPISLNNYANELLKKQEYEKALEQLRKAFSLYPYEPTLRRNLAEAYAYVGNRQLEKNSYEEAAATFDRARELFPDEVKYVMMRGVALYLAKNYDAAQIELERARSNGGETAEVLFFLGRARYDTGSLSGAIELWEQALQLDPTRKVIQEALEKARRESKVEAGMDRGYSSRFTVSYDTGTSSDLADSILSTLEDAYNQVGSDLSHFPTSRVPLIIYTKKDYRTITTSPEWSGGLYDGKIRLPVGGASKLTPLLQGVLFHEYTHVVVQELAAGRCPTWLNEGLAEYEERRVFERPLTELKRRIRQGSVLSFDTLERSFASLATNDVVLAYEQSYSLVSYMISTYGWHKVRDILVNLGAGMNQESAVTAALEDFGLDFRKVVEEWTAFAAKEFAE